MAQGRALLKNLMLPVSMIGGVVFYKWMHYLTWMSPYLIFMMLVVTYCRLDLREVRPRRFEWTLLGAQLCFSGLVYACTCWWNHTLAEGLFICVFIPTATAAPVITRMLGGSIAKVVTYSLISNITMAVLGPVLLAAIGDHPEMGFGESFLLICRKVFPLLILPIVTALLLQRAAPKWHAAIAGQQIVSFYLWAFSLFIVVGGSVAFAINHFHASEVPTMTMLCVGSFIVCVAQFAIGKRIGRDAASGRDGAVVREFVISGGQSLGQKNTVLAIWLALAYMSPLASLAPASYVAWHNIVNSYQLWRQSAATA